MRRPDLYRTDCGLSEAFGDLWEVYRKRQVHVTCALEQSDEQCSLCRVVDSEETVAVAER